MGKSNEKIGRVIAPHERFKYLGVFFTANLSWIPQREYLKEIATDLKAILQRKKLKRQ